MAFKRARGLAGGLSLLWRLQVPRRVRRVLAWSYWRCRHQWVAQGCHYRWQQLELQQVQL